MAEINVPACPTHGSIPRALHTENFEGIVTVIENIIETVSGVGTVSYSRCPYGYPWNFEGVVRALEDLNTSISGVQGGGGGGGSNVVAGSGIYIVASGEYDVINADYGIIVSGALIAGSNIDFDFSTDGRLEINSLATISGVQSAVYVQDTAPPETNGALWFDTAQGRLFVFAEASGWYQTNTEAISYKSEVPPSGSAVGAPPRDGSLWFNTLMGNLFVYDAPSSGWYETGPSRSFAFTPTEPAPSVPGAGWFNSDSEQIKVWNGSVWADITISGGAS